MGRFPSRRDRSNQDRKISISSASSAFRPPEQTKKAGKAGLNSLIDAGRASPTSMRQSGRRAPVVYPALLSRVAQAFRERIPVSDRVKDGLTYKDAFDGREAVDKIAYIIKTTDRNLALLLGRALDAQKFFHDVTYDHRLRDNLNELYQFRTKLPDSYMSGELAEMGSADAGMKLNGQVCYVANGLGALPTHFSSVRMTILRILHRRHLAPMEQLPMTCLFPPGYLHYSPIVTRQHVRVINYVTA